MRQMADCAIKEKAENLLEQLINGRTLGGCLRMEPKSRVM